MRWWCVVAASTREGNLLILRQTRRMGEFAFQGQVVEWRGPAPYFFVRLPADVSADVKAAAAGLEYWGQVAVSADIAGVEFTTALFPRDGAYLLPLKAAVRDTIGVVPGDAVAGTLRLRPRAW